MIWRKLYTNVFLATLGAVGMFLLWGMFYKLPFNLWFNAWSIITSVAVWLMIFFYLHPNYALDEKSEENLKEAEGND